MKRIIFILLIALAPCLSGYKTSDPVTYRIYDKTGKVVTWAEVMNFCKKQDAVFFGELHNNAIAHWMQLELTKALYKENANLILGAEMFEADQQLILDEYLNKSISEKNFETEMRLWSNYKTDYKPLVNFALENKLKFIATNVPRRYASMVAKKGKDELLKLGDDAKKYICPLPLEADTSLKGYREMLKMDMGHGSTSLNMVYAQAIKDATMGYFIAKNLPEKGLFIHYNGAYHSNHYEGIVYYLKQYKQGVKVATLTTVEQDDVMQLDPEQKGVADFILVVDSDVTHTH